MQSWVSICKYNRWQQTAKVQQITIQRAPTMWRNCSFVPLYTTAADWLRLPTQIVKFIRPCFKNRFYNSMLNHGHVSTENSKHRFQILFNNSILNDESNSGWQLARSFRFLDVQTELSVRCSDQLLQVVVTLKAGKLSWSFSCVTNFISVTLWTAEQQIIDSLLLKIKFTSALQASAGKNGLHGRIML